MSVHKKTTFRQALAFVARLPSLGPNWVAAVSLVFIMLIICVGVFTRVFKEPIQGAYELSEILMIFLIFIGISYAEMRRRHVTMSLVTTNVPAKVRVALRFVTQAISTVIFGFMTWQTIVQGLNVMNFHQTTTALSIPIAPFYFVAAAGSAMMCLVLLVSLAEPWLKEPSR